MHDNHRLDEVFYDRAVQRGYLHSEQVASLRMELDDRRRHEPDVFAHEYAVECGLMTPDAALAVLDARPDETAEQLKQRLLRTQDSDITSRHPPVEGSARDTERFQKPGAVQPLDAEEDEFFGERPKLVEPLAPQNAYEDGASGDSHLEMELPPPASRSGESIFDDSQNLAPLDTDEGLDPLPITSTQHDDISLGDLDVDGLEEEEEIVEPASPELQPQGLEPEPSDTLGGDTLGGGDTSPGITGAGVTASDTLDGYEQPEDASGMFEVRGTKGALDDFASYGDDELEPALDESDESEEISVHLIDSAVGEVMEQADDSYFGPAADLTQTPDDMLKDSIAPPVPLPYDTVLDVEGARESDSAVTGPPTNPELHDSIAESDIIFTADSEFPTDPPEFVEESVEETVDDTIEAFDDTGQTLGATALGLHEIEDDSQVRTDTQASTGSRTQYATGEGGRPGLRNRTDSKVGVESGTGDTGQEITGQEMTLADLRAQMGIGQGVKVGSPEASSSTLGRIKKGSKRRYTVIREIARGGMGKVIEVEDNDLRRSVALKILRKEMLNRADLVERFLEEAQITGQLEHPNIVPVHEIGVDGRGNLYFTMKLVEGEELASILKRLRKGDSGAAKAYPLTRLVDLFIKVCEGVAFAHSRGVIHRDLKPANIMVGRFGEVQIMDWGVAKIIGRKEDTGERTVGSDRQEDDASKTMIGSILGTPSYMSPEQAEGKVDYMGPASDIFSLGIILYELLSLHTPWTGQSSAEVIDQVKHYDPDPPSKRAPDRRIPPELEQLAMKCLVKQSHKRLESVSDLIDNLRSWQEGRTLAAVEYSIGQLIGKWIARNKVIVITSLLVLAAMVVGVIGTYQQLKQRELERSDALIAEAREKYEQANVSFAASQYEEAQHTATEAANDFRGALIINPDSSEAQDGQMQAVVLAGNAQRALDQLRTEAAEREARERDQRLLSEALADARDRNQAAEDLDNDPGASTARVAEAYNDARAAWQRVQTLEEGNAEAGVAIAAIDVWQRGVEARRQAEADLRRLNELVTEAEKQLSQARNLPPERYEDATRGLMTAISISDQALAVPVSGDAADSGRERALVAKAQAALEFGRRATVRQRYDVAELMLDIGDSTSRLAGDIQQARADLGARVAEQSRFRQRMHDAEEAVRGQEWVLAQTAINLALAEARQSRYATEGDVQRLERMMELARLEDLHARDTNARSSEQLLGVYAEYDALLEALTDADYRTRAISYREDVRRRLATTLITEAEATEDDAVRIELYDRALEFLTDRAVIADVRARLSEARLRLAMVQVSDRVVLLPRGTFIVGSNREGDQNPQRQYEHNDFVFIERHLVTNTQFKDFVDDNGYTRPELWPEEALPFLTQFVDASGQPGPAGWNEGGFDGSLAHYPVTGISWFEAAAYAKWAGKRLPTPDEWEVAAGAPRLGEIEAVVEYPFGPRDVAPPFGVAEPREVGTAEWDANRHGVRDMGCNVAEWTAEVNGDRAVVKGAEPGLRTELYFRYARRAKNSVARLVDRSTGRGFRCVEDFTLETRED